MAERLPKETLFSEEKFEESGEKSKLTEGLEVEALFKNKGEDVYNDLIDGAVQALALTSKDEFLQNIIYHSSRYGFGNFNINFTNNPFIISPLQKHQLTFSIFKQTKTTFLGLRSCSLGSLSLMVLEDWLVAAP